MEKNIVKDVEQNTTEINEQTSADNDAKLNLPATNIQWEQRQELNKLNVASHWFFFWRLLKKAKKINRKMKQDAGYYSEQYRYTWLRKKAIKMLKIVKVKANVINVENWLDRGCILAGNHQSNVDPLLIYAINDFQKQQPVAFIAKKELWDSSLSARFVNIIDVVPLDRENPRSALAAVKEAKELITKYKRSFTIFPEGTRSKSQEMIPFLDASLKIAQMAYAPIIPFAIIDSYKTTMKKRPKKITVTVVFGKPIMPDTFMHIKAEKLASNVQKEVQKLINKYQNWNPEKLGLKPESKKDRCKFYKVEK
ncbi:lysophospholipid acyltransferase family protein [Spiroplasma endosymbiont of Crioceris asparagi]|uniref:lysophospholipid acyltransferase family protein n=1 Tax=Spiroplasma endosymbiont of Crioceris asparagi TaxID=3066286 RepID=UPI0030CB4C40